MDSMGDYDARFLSPTVGNVLRSWATDELFDPTYGPPTGITARQNLVLLPLTKVSETDGGKTMLNMTVEYPAINPQAIFRLTGC